MPTTPKNIKSAIILAIETKLFFVAMYAKPYAKTDIPRATIAPRLTVIRIATTANARNSLPKIELPHTNKTTHHDYRKYYDEDTKELVRLLFKDDVIRFNYTF